MIRATSIAAYRDLQASGKLFTQRGMIISIVAGRANYSLREIQRDLERRYHKFLDVGTVSARVKAMKDDGILVEEPLPRKCTVTDRVINPVRIADSQIDESA